MATARVAMQDHRAYMDEHLHQGGGFMSRVVVTGLGLITSLGNDLASSWEALCQGKSGVAEIEGYDLEQYRVHFGGQVKTFDPALYMDRKEVRRTDPYEQLAIATTKQALAQSGLQITGENAGDIGVYIGSGIGGLVTLHEQFRVLFERGPDRISPFFINMMIVDGAPGAVSIMTGAKGPNWAAVSACATSGNTVGEAWETIRRGDARAMIAGGSEKAITPIAMAAFDNMHALSRRNDDPQGASRPFDATRDGFVMGEGSAMLILEDLDFARARGATALAELIGYGSTGDAHHITEPAPGGEGLVRAMRRALQKAGLRPDQVDYINAHGTSTPFNDRTETQAIKTCFGEHAYRLAISSTKSMTGHTLGAAGAVEAVISIMAIQSGIIPPTINLRTPDPECDLDYVPNEARRATVNIAMSNSMGFGGHNTCLIFKRYEG
jgi:3-oxoacyl-[acyl-carrier-protein] synthase II